MTATNLTARRLSAVLDSEPRRCVDGPTAAVAAVFRSGAVGTELLFIQRAAKDSDPWSGHMAFPGGRTDPTDADSLATAERETREELALDLSDDSTFLGSLNDLEPSLRPGGLRAVHCHGYWLDGDRPALTPNYEVADALWVPISVLTDANRHIDYHYPRTNSSWPGIQLDDPNQVVWGLTLRFLADLFDRLDQPFVKLAPWSG